MQFKMNSGTLYVVTRMYSTTYELRIRLYLFYTIHNDAHNTVFISYRYKLCIRREKGVITDEERLFLRHNSEDRALCLHAFEGTPQKILGGLRMSGHMETNPLTLRSYQPISPGALGPRFPELTVSRCPSAASMRRSETRDSLFSEVVVGNPPRYGCATLIES